MNDGIQWRAGHHHNARRDRTLTHTRISDDFDFDFTPLGDDYFFLKERSTLSRW